MTTLLLNTLAVVLMLFFGAMAYYPLFLKSADTEAPAETYPEDVVVSVVPAPMEQKKPTPISIPRRTGNDPEHPGHRPAA